MTWKSLIKKIFLIPSIFSDDIICVLTKYIDFYTNTDTVENILNFFNFFHVEQDFFTFNPNIDCQAPSLSLFTLFLLESWHDNQSATPHHQKLFKCLVGDLYSSVIIHHWNRPCDQIQIIILSPIFSEWN